MQVIPRSLKTAGPSGESLGNENRPELGHYRAGSPRIRHPRSQAGTKTTNITPETHKQIDKYARYRV